MGNTHRVLRQFHADTLRNPGDEVDASEWKNVKALEDQRYIERLDTDTPALSRSGPTPDPKLIQETVARRGDSKNSETGGIAAMPEIDEQSGGQEPDTPALRGKLAEDFPGHAALEAEDVTTYAQVRRRIKDGTLKDIPGIGDATAAKIVEAAGVGDGTDE